MPSEFGGEKKVEMEVEVADSQVGKSQERESSQESWQGKNKEFWKGVDILSSEDGRVMRERKCSRD